MTPEQITAIIHKVLEENGYALNVAIVDPRRSITGYRQLPNCLLKHSLKQPLYSGYLRRGQLTPVFTPAIGTLMTRCRT